MDIRLEPLAVVELEELPVPEQKAFHKVVERFELAAPDVRRHMLTTMHSPGFRARGVTHTLRLNRKYRILLGRDDEGYAIKGVVSRGDSRFYKSE